MKMDRAHFWRPLLVLMLCCGLIMAFSLAGCGGKDKEVETEVPQPEPEPLPPAPEPEPEETTTTGPAIDYATTSPQDYGIRDVYFGYNQYDLSAEATSILSGNAEIMRGIQGATWVVEGHCDERGTIEYNLALGEKRAKAVRDHLVNLGVPAAQLRVTSYGESKPFAQGSSEDVWAANRRAHFALP